VFTEQLSWRWVFYINLPVGAVALAVVATALHTPRRSIQHRVDYLGAAVLSMAATTLILMLTWGGTTYSWTSAPVLGLGVGTLVLVAVFIRIEQTAVEPILPLRLFGDSIFRVASIASAIVGFSMFGAMTFLPLFLQTVHLVSPTLSGLQLLPIMVFVLSMAIWSGRQISARGRYRAYPIAGTIILTFGLFGLSEYGIGISTPYWKTAIFMALIGAGLGLTMQVLILAVQNSVNFSDLGVATSTATFARSIGGSVGVAVFGEIFANRLAAHLAKAGPVLARVGPRLLHVQPSQLHRLKDAQPALFNQFLQALQPSLHVVFIAAVPFAALGIVCALLLREVPLRSTTGHSAGMDAASSQALPQAAETAQSATVPAG
jgi:MFS family permease